MMMIRSSKQKRRYEVLVTGLLASKVHDTQAKCLGSVHILGLSFFISKFFFTECFLCEKKLTPMSALLLLNIN